MSPDRVASARQRTVLPKPRQGGEGLIVGLDHAELSGQGWLHLHRGRDGRVVVAVTERPGPVLRALVETHLGEEVDFAVTSSWDMAKGLTTLYRDAIADEAALGLWRRSPARSALSPWCGCCWAHAGRTPTALSGSDHAVRSAVRDQ